jgi:outer membrane protein
VNFRSAYCARTLLASLALFPSLIAAGQAVTSVSTPAAMPSGPLTLTQAIDLAQAKYPAIRAAEEREAAAHSAIGVARTAYLPRMDMLWQNSRSTTNKPNIAAIPQGIVPIPDTPARAVDGHSDWNSAAGVLLAWQPFDFGQRNSQVKAARYGAEAAKQATSLSRLNVAWAAAGAFFDAAAARKDVDVQQANVERMEVFARTVHVLVDNTLRPGADTSQADAQLALARTQLIQAQTEQEVRLDALANFLQIPAEQLKLNIDNLLDAPSPTGFETVGIGTNPEVEQQAAVVGQQKEQVRALNRTYAPVFTLYGSVSGLGAGLASTSTAPAFEGGTAGLVPSAYNWMAAIQVTFPAFQVFTIHQQRREQEANVRSAEASYQQLLGDLSAQVKEARAMLDGARRIAQNTPVELTSARQSEQQQQARYRSGLATVVDVSAAEGVLAQAEADDAIARLSVWRAELGIAVAQGDLQPFLQMLQSESKGR